MLILVVFFLIYLNFDIPNPSHMFDLQFPIFNTDYELYLRFPLYILDNKPTQYISLVVTLSNSESSYIMSKVELMEICDECAIPTPEWCYLDDVTLVYIYIN